VAEKGPAMTAFSLEPAQLAWCAELRALAAERLRPLAEKGEAGRVNRALVAELGSLSLLGRLFTSGALDLCLMRESLAYACTEAETALALQGPPRPRPRHAEPTRPLAPPGRRRHGDRGLRPQRAGGGVGRGSTGADRHARRPRPLASHR
jgi:hypothetical protein